MIDGEGLATRAFGACDAHDRVSVREDGAALVLVRGVRVVLRTADGDTTVHVLDRGASPRWIATRRDGTFIGSEGMHAWMRYRAPGPLLTAPMRALDPARESQAILGAFATPTP